MKHMLRWLTVIAFLLLFLGVALPSQGVNLPSMGLTGDPKVEFQNVSMASSVSAGSSNAVSFSVLNTADYAVQGNYLCYVYLKSSNYALNEELFWSESIIFAWEAHQVRDFAFTYSVPIDSVLSQFSAANDGSMYLFVGFQIVEFWSNGVASNIYENYRVLINGYSDVAVLDGSTVVPTSAPTVTVNPTATPSVAPSYSPTPTPVPTLSPDSSHTPFPVIGPDPPQRNYVNAVSGAGGLMLLFISAYAGGKWLVEKKRR